MKTTNYYIQNVSGSLVIKYDLTDDSSGKYAIPLDTLDDIRTENGDNLSDWIMQLLPKTWSTSDMLYDLAKQIQYHKSDNQIDWVATFLAVETRYYLDEVGKKNDSETDRDSDFQNVVEGIKFSKSIQADPEFDKIINERVSLNLKKANLLPKS